MVRRGDGHGGHLGVDQRNGAVLHLAGRGGLGVQVADLLHLKAALKADGIIDPSSDKKDILCIGLLGGKPLKPFLILDDPADLVRKCLQFLNVGLTLLL